MLFGTWDPTKFSIAVGSTNAVGYGDGTFIKGMRNEPTFSIRVGADGGATRVRNANRSGRFEVTLQQSSPTNDAFQAQAAIDEQSGGGVKPTFVKDANGNANAQGNNTWIVQIPDLERGKEAGDVTWILEADVLDLHQGGNTPIPGTA